MCGSVRVKPRLTPTWMSTSCVPRCSRARVVRYTGTHEKDEPGVLVDKCWAPAKREVDFLLLEAENSRAKAPSSGMELSMTVPCPADGQCSLVVQEQEEEVKTRPTCKFLKVGRYRVDDDNYALLSPDCHASDVKFYSYPGIFGCGLHDTLAISYRKFDRARKIW